MQPKSLLASKTVWGALVAAAPQIVEVAKSGALGPKAAAAISAVGFFVTLWGRITATRPVRVPGLLPCLLFPLALLGLVFAPGCTSTGRADSKLIAQIGVSFAVGKVIENNPAYAPRIAEIAAHVVEIAGQQSTSVPLVIQAARDAIDWEKLSPADTTLAKTLLLAVEVELQRRVSDGVLPEEMALAVAEVAGWIERAARGYTTPEGMPSR